MCGTCTWSYTRYFLNRLLTHARLRMMQYFASSYIPQMKQHEPEGLGNVTYLLT